jgi:hypothetical protein
MISVNKINNLRKLTKPQPEISRRAKKTKNTFQKKIARNRHKNTSATAFWRIRPKFTFQKPVKTPIKLPSDAKAVNRIYKVWPLGHIYS